VPVLLLFRLWPPPSSSSPTDEFWEGAGVVVVPVVAAAQIIKPNDGYWDGTRFALLPLQKVPVLCRCCCCSGCGRRRHHHTQRMDSGTGWDVFSTPTAQEGAGVIVVPVVATVAIIIPSGWIPGRDGT